MMRSTPKKGEDARDVFRSKQLEMEMDSNASHWGDKQQMMHSSEHNEQQPTKICIFTVKSDLK